MRVDHELLGRAFVEIGSPAKTALDAATAKSKSADFKERSKTILSIVEMREKLSPKLRQAHQGIELELLHDNKAWLKYFCMAKHPYEEEKSGCFSKTDMETLGAGVLRNLKELDYGTKSKTLRQISAWHLVKLIPEIVCYLKDADRQVRCAAAYALGELGAKESIPDLLACLKDTDKDLRTTTASALGYLDAKEAVPDLILCLKDDDENVRRYAKEALKKLQETPDSVQKSPIKVE